MNLGIYSMLIETIFILAIHHIKMSIHIHRRHFEYDYKYRSILNINRIRITENLWRLIITYVFELNRYFFTIGIN
jgi:hypothetical protein